MSKKTRILLFGASGRMGQEVIACATGADSQIIAGIVGEDSKSKGLLVDGVLEPLDSDWRKHAPGCDVILDFSNASATDSVIKCAREFGKPVVICSTGHNQSQSAAILSLSEQVPVIKASNTSLGVAALNKMVSLACNLLGEEFDIEISEVHHNKKKDSPSGTALTLAETVCSERPALSVNSARSGERKVNEVGVVGIRGGSVFGEHTVYFLSDGERIELTHKAQNRSIFALGGIKASKWLTEKERRPSLYSMGDIIS